MWVSSSIFPLLLLSSRRSFAFTSPAHSKFALRNLDGQSQMRASSDTPETLPDFANLDDYLKYLETVSALPKGFATGTGEGTFVSVEAPALGQLKIRGTIIHLTEGPTDNWAACFTSNMVSCG